MDVHLRRLRAFVTVAEELHFTRAAAKLFVAQQSLSKQIADLESEVGTPLFERTSRRVDLTPAGEVFLAAVREALALVDRGAEEARNVGSGGHATLRVGFVAGAALELTTHILGGFTDRFPHARVELREFGLADPTAGLAAAETDVAFIRLPCTTRGLVVHPLFTEPCVVGVSTAHPLSGRDRVRVEDLADQPIAVGRTGDAVWRAFWTLGHRPGAARPARLVETTSQSEEMEVVAAGMACCLTPAAAVRYSPRPGIRFLRIEDHPGSVVAVAHRDHAGGPLVSGFVEAAAAARERAPEVVRAIESAGLS
ncbi:MULTISPECIES: LysR family transcriptional regulator [unclassified Nocardiopsis]|uniref:LysR family transcriptional regulator n=1 Tax=Nocardiopsis TaxID=2013 RepID=UPI00387B2D71